MRERERERKKRNARVGDECGLGGVPSEGADAELQGSESLHGVAELEVAHVGAAELEGVPPRRAGDAAHLQVDPHERGLPHAHPQFLQGLHQVPPRHLLDRHLAAAIAICATASAARGRRGGQRPGGSDSGLQRWRPDGEEEVAEAALHGRRRWGRRRR
jgi:hypothetical protein